MAHICTVRRSCHAEVNFVLVSMGVISRAVALYKQWVDKEETNQAIKLQLHSNHQ